MPKFLYIARWLWVAALFTVGACGQRGDAELQWARAALERNPNVKVLEVDAQANRIRLQDKVSGAVLEVTPGELAAISIADLVALTERSKLAAAAPAGSIDAAETAEAPIPAKRESSNVIEVRAQPPRAPTAPVAYNVQREDGRVRVTGPGVSIESSSTVQPNVAMHYDEPIICDGRRLLHFDGRELNVHGDAITVRGGCELHITNSRIAATGVGIVVLNGAVHISNSSAQGAGASLELGPQSKAFIRGSQFQGISRRDPNATLRDLGGNTWR